MGVLPGRCLRMVQRAREVNGQALAQFTYSLACMDGFQPLRRETFLRRSIQFGLRIILQLVLPPKGDLKRGVPVPLFHGLLSSRSTSEMCPAVRC